MLSRQACHILLLCIQTGRHCHSHLLSDRCCAGNPLRRAPACYKWADALRDMLRLKISPSHLTLAARTGKCVWRPLVLFLYLPVTHAVAAQAEPARHAVWLWHVCTEQQNTQRGKKTNLLPFSYLCRWVDTQISTQASFCTTSRHTNKCDHECRKDL